MNAEREDSKAVTRQFVENAWNNGRYDLGYEHLAPNFVNHTPFGEESRQQFLDRIKVFRTAFPDLRMTVEDMLADGDRVITRFRLRGSHQGPFRGIAATGRPVDVMGIAIDRVDNAQRVEGWAILDLLGLLQQLGMTLSPET
jgi:predicted ester cyclase